MKLRFEVFNLELGEGHASSFLTGRDRDEFDSTSHHLILIDRSNERVIGTYRLRTYETTKAIEGFCLSHEFDLSTLPLEVLAKGIEISRFCIAKAHRNFRSQKVLWNGLSLALTQTDKRYIFGALALATQDPLEAGRIFDRLRDEDQIHSEFKVKPKPGSKCLWYRIPDERQRRILIPSWFRICLRSGTKLCGPPAINRQFRTIDFPALLDLKQIAPSTRSILFGA